MNNKKANFLLYQLNPLKRLEEIKLKEQGIKEKYIENLFSENLENIFHDLIFLETQSSIKDKKGSIHYADTLAFDKKNNTFVVFEYKREESRDLFHQAKFYLLWLLKKEWITHENRRKIESIFKKKFGGNQEKWGEFEWEKSYALCITNDIGKYKDYFLETEEKIKLVEIKFYKDDILHINCENLPDGLRLAPMEEKIGRNPSFFQSSTSTISELVEAIEPSNLYLIQWLEELNKLVTEKFNWKERVYFSLPYTGGGRRRYVRNYIKYYSQNSKKTLFSLVVWKKQFNSYWNFSEPTKVSSNLSNILKKYQVEYKKEGHWGEGNWHFKPVENENSFQELKDFIQEYKKNCGEEPKLD